MLDEFRAADGGDQKFGFLAGRASAVVHRAAKTLLQNGVVDFAQFRCRGGILDAHHNAVGMKKIFNRRSFAKEFRIGRHAELCIAVSRISGESPAELESGARGDGAFFDHQLRRARFRGDLPRHVIDGG